MIIAFIIISVMTLALFLVAYRRGDGSHVRGIKIGYRMLSGVTPLLLLAFAVAGLIQVSIPPEMIRSWLGDEAGLRGILIGSAAGALIVGGPYVSFPIIAAIYKSGAGIGTTVALITGWALLGLGQIPFELALIGPRFTLVRVSVSLVVPPLSGWIAHILFTG